MTHQFRGNGNHYNGGAKFFGYGFDAVGEPRLMMVRKWFRQGELRGKTVDEFFVDGAKVDSYDAAIEALKTPPTFTPEEIAALSVIGDEATDHRDAVDRRILYSLRHKGAIEYAVRGRCRRTDVGRAAVASAGDAS
jgi:hypothetical protein